MSAAVDQKENAATSLQKWRARLSPEILAELLPPPTVPFASNAAYRHCLRRLFNMSPDARTAFGDGAAVLDPSVEMDAETADELAFDTAQAEVGMRELYMLSEEDPEFLCLYDRVGYTFMALNPEVGISALMNFDDFAPFCRAMAVFLHSPNCKKPKYAPELFALLDKFRPRDA